MTLFLLLSTTGSFADSAKISDKRLCIAAGSRIPVNSNTDITGGAVPDNAPFSVTLIEDLLYEGAVAFPLGTRIDGVVKVSSNETGSSKKLLLQFQTIEDPAAEKLPISAELVQHGGAFHMKRELTDIQIRTEFRPPTVLGIGISGCDVKRKTHVKRVRPTFAVGKSSDAHRSQEAQSPPDSHVRLISDKRNPVTIKKGDGFKIELQSDLLFPKLAKTSESQ
jgi:hypothetical protein